MCVLGFVELQGAADAVDDRFGDAGGVAALEALVVLRAHPGHERDLFATQPRDAAATAEVRQTHLGGREFRPPRGEELADGVLGVHVVDGTPTVRREGVPGGAPITRASLASAYAP